MRLILGTGIIAIVFTLAACSSPVTSSSRIKSSDAVGRDEQDGDDDDNDDGLSDKRKKPNSGSALENPEESPFALDAPTMMTCSLDGGRRYKGFGNSELSAGRVTEVPLEMDRFRIKSLQSLSAEFARVVGTVPLSLAANQATFIDPGPRWFVEPLASGVTLFTVYRVAFEAGLKFVDGNPDMVANLAEPTVTEVCRNFAITAWQKQPTEAQVASCAKLALIDTAPEPDPKARWAYALASILTSTEFINY